MVLTSDHGDQMGDHWLIEKLGWWDESYHVPLIVVDPRRVADATRGTFVDAFTESVDVMPTLCQWLGVEVPIAVDGRPLQPFLHGDEVPTDWRTEAHWQWDFRDPVRHLGEDVFGLTMEQCCLDVVRTATHKYIHFGDGAALLFDLTDDPDQLVDRAGDPAAAWHQVDLMGRLLSWRQRHDDEPSPAPGSPPSTAPSCAEIPDADGTKAGEAVDVRSATTGPWTARRRPQGC